MKRIFKKAIKPTSQQNIKPASQMWVESITPQMEAIIAQIEEAKDRGRSWTYLSGELVAHQNLATLLATGYDIHITYYSFESHGFSYDVSWGPLSSGVLTFEDEETKARVAYLGAKLDNSDVVKHRGF